MSKVTLDMSTFKALASDTRLDILRSLDGKKMSLKDISTATKLNKATLHEHLAKLHEADLVKRKERQGHKWVYYKLSWKGECLLHPENTRIVVLFATTFITLCVGIIQLMLYVKGRVTDFGYNAYNFGQEVVLTEHGTTSDVLKKGLVDDGYGGSVLTDLMEEGESYLASNSVNNTVFDFLAKFKGGSSIPKIYSDKIPVGEGTNYSWVGTGDIAPTVGDAFIHCYCLFYSLYSSTMYCSLETLGKQNTKALKHISPHNKTFLI
jgi:DNA-binding transcriptional ArsR family regulator